MLVYQVVFSSYFTVQRAYGEDHTHEV